MTYILLKWLYILDYYSLSMRVPTPLHPPSGLVTSIHWPTVEGISDPNRLCLPKAQACAAPSLRSDQASPQSLV